MLYKPACFGERPHRVLCKLVVAFPDRRSEGTFKIFDREAKSSADGAASVFSLRDFEFSKKLRFNQKSQTPLLSLKKCSPLRTSQPFFSHCFVLHSKFTF